MFAKMRLLICVTLIVSAYSAPDFKFTKIGYAIVDGKTRLCINDCVNNLCILDHSWKYHPCRSSSINAPTSYTYQKRYAENKCLSRCDRIGTSYSWCYVKPDGSWDRCNSNLIMKWSRNKTFTQNNGICKDECKPQSCGGSKCASTCYHYYGSWDFCDNKGLDFIQGHTFLNDVCLGPCTSKDKPYKTCVFYNGKYSDRCAPPTQPWKPSWSSRIEQFLNLVEPQRYTFPLNTFYSNDILSILAGDLENDPRFITVHNNDDSPVKKYVYGGNDHHKPTLPMLVRAEITLKYLNDNPNVTIPDNVKKNLEAMGMLKNNYAQLVGPSLSGPMEVFNFLPMANKLNEFHKNEESKIFNYLKDNSESNVRVSLLVIIVYEKEADITPRVVIMEIEIHLENKMVDHYFYVLPYLPN